MWWPGTLDFHHQGAFWPQQPTLPEAESALQEQPSTKDWQSLLF